MNLIPSSPPQIKPLSNEATRPLWSVMIPVYNCSQFLIKTLESVLVQSISEKDMQIEVVDDASTDTDVEALVNSIGKGRIKYFRQPENVGSLRNFETCINRSRGHIVHILHGDDQVKNGYYATLGNLFKQYPEAGAAFCRYTYVDEQGNKLYDEEPEMAQEGILKDWLLYIGERQRIQYVSIAVRREVYEKLGAFYGLTYGEDWEMWVRIAKYYPVAYTPNILAEYRMHSDSISGTKFLTGQNTKDMVQVMEIIKDYLPPDQQEAIFEKSKKFYAYYGVWVANELWHKLHDVRAVKAQIKQALHIHKDPILYWQILKIYIKILINKK